MRASAPAVTEAIPTSDTDIDQERLDHQSNALAGLFRSWREVGDEGLAEQRETLEIIKRVLNEEPLSDRPRVR